MISETTGYAGGGIPQKSFSFKYRAKRVINKQPNKLVLAQSEAKCPFTGGGAVDAEERIFSASLDARR